MTTLRPILLGMVIGVYGLASSSAGEPIDATLCELVRNPAAFSGKMVRVRAQVNTGFEFSVILADCDQKGASTALYYPDTVRDSDRPDFSLVKDKNFKQFEEALSKYSVVKLCMGPCPEKPAPPGHVIATLVGRFDGPDKLTVTDRMGKTVVRKGYGFTPSVLYQTRLILKRVSEVTISK